VKKFVLVLCLAGLTLAADCHNGSGGNAEQKQSATTAEMQQEAWRQIGMPDIVNFQEMRFAKQIQELRDQEVTTYTYTVDRSGQLHFLCQSVGYGLPYSTQMTNPEKVARSGHNYGYAVTPQAEPNQLYMPDNVDATWVLCLDESEGDVDPIYSEPKLLVSPYPLNHVDSYYDAEAQASTETPGIGGQ
jgi:hypothetical protein